MDKGEAKTERADERRIGVAISEYRAAYPDPFLVGAGEELAIDRRESEWPGWVWCTNRDGESRWVPEAYVERKGDTGIARCDYDATELSVRAGEALSLGREESGWFWCTNRVGQCGWVPAQHLRLPD